MEIVLTTCTSRDSFAALTKPRGRLGIDALRHNLAPFKSVGGIRSDSPLDGRGSGSRRSGSGAGCPFSGYRVSARGRGRLGTLRTRTLGLTLLAVALALPAAPARADLIVLQESNGFPGAPDDGAARQKVAIASEKLKVLDDQHGWALLVRLDQKVVREANAAERTFVEKPFADFAKIRQDREATRKERIASYRKELETARTDGERAELKKALDRSGLREDGQTLARTETFPEDARTVKLVVNGLQKDLKVEHWKVRENESADPIFDVWLAPGLARPESVFKFYREIGTFSDAVVEKVMSLPGFPVEITAVLDNGNNKKTLHSRVFEVRDEAVESIEYEIPAGWKLVQPKDQKGGPRQTAACEICGRTFELGEGEGGVWTNPFTRTKHPFCSGECRSTVIQRQAAAQRERRGTEEQPK